MKKRTVYSVLACLLLFTVLTSEECSDTRPSNTSALDEQAHTELNQRRLMTNQPPPSLNWSLERENITKRELLQNDRTVSFYMYILLEGYGVLGYYQVNKVSSVNSQLTNTMQIVTTHHSSGFTDNVLPSPAEDGSYGTNGEAVFGFTPEDAYIEHNCKYITSTVPLHFEKPVPLLAQITSEQAKEIQATMNRLGVGANKPAPAAPPVVGQPNPADQQKP